MKINPDHETWDNDDLDCPECDEIIILDDSEEEESE